MFSAFSATAAGLGLGLSLIIAIGAQNAFVLRQGVRRKHVAVVVAICAVSDAVLILAGISGIGAIASVAPWVIPVTRWGGAAFLTVYALLALRRAFRPDSLGLASRSAPAGRTATILSCLALTWLNPHVYLDTMVFLGSIGTSYGDLRWWFGAGAVSASLLWFTALGFGAHLLEPVFRSRRSWQILDTGIACVMLAIAVSLVRGA